MNKETALLCRETRHKRIVAFVVTSLAVFTIAILAWPLTMCGYQTESVLSIGKGPKTIEQIQASLPSILQKVLSPPAIDRHIANLKADSDSNDDWFLTCGAEVIASQVSVGFRQKTASAPPQLRLVFSGNGTRGERHFVSSLANDVLMLLAFENHGQSNDLDSDTSGSAVSSQKHLEQADWLVAQIEDGLEVAKSKTVKLVTNAKVNDGETPFQSVGHVREIPTPEFDALHQTLESVDVVSLRGVIDDMKARGNLTSVKTLTHKPIKTTQKPVGAIPEDATIALLGMFSILFGGVVAWNIRPFADKGFTDVSEVAKTLGVPVVATINRQEAAPRLHDEARSSGWANQVTAMSGTVLVAFAVLTAGFWFVYPNVQAAFEEGIFHGFARIVWTLSGG